MRRTLVAYLALVVTAFVVQLVAAWAVGAPLPDPSRFWERWVSYDGHRYLQIAREGYSWNPTGQSTVAWFPGYPMVIAAIAGLGVRPELAAATVTLVAGAASFVLLDRWCVGRGATRREAGAAVAAMALMPYAFYLYGIVYSDALFTALCLAAVVAYERRLLVPALLAAALATATRPTGLAVVAYLAAAELERGRSWRTLAVPLAGAGGLVAYVVYLGARFDAPFGFVSTQQYFRGSSVAGSRLVRAVVDGLGDAGPLALVAALATGVATLLVARWVRRRWSTAAAVAVVGVGAVAALVAARWSDVLQYPAYRSTTAAQALLCVAAAASVPAVARAYGRPAAVFLAVLVLIPAVSTGDFMGAGRYLIVAFPLWALWGRRLAAAGRWGVAALALAGVVMLSLSAAFTRGAYIA